MNNIENLYVVAMEECAEMQQCISKILRFGEDNFHPDRPNETNAKELLVEYYQLQKVIEMLMNENVLQPLTRAEIEEIKAKKQINVTKYWNLSREIGRIE